MRVICRLKRNELTSSPHAQLCSNFTQHTFLNWLRCTSLGGSEHELSQTRSDIYQAGVDTIFSADILRQAQGQPDALIEDAFRRGMNSCRDAVLSCMPAILLSYIQITQKYRNTLFSQGSSRGSSVSAEQARKAGMKFFSLCMSVINDVVASHDTWKTTAALLEVVDSQRLMGADDEDATKALKGVAENACRLLASSTTGSCIDTRTLGCLLT